MAPLRCAAKFDPFLSFDCAPTPSTLAQSKERKGSNFAIWQHWREARLADCDVCGTICRVGRDEAILSRVIKSCDVTILVAKCGFVKKKLSGKGKFVHVSWRESGKFPKTSSQQKLDFCFRWGVIHKVNHWKIHCFNEMQYRRTPICLVSPTPLEWN